MKHLSIVITVFLYLSPFALAADKEAQFIDQTKHLNFNAPKSCNFEASIVEKKLSGSFELSQKSCRISRLRAPSDIEKRLEVFVCAMLVPALNTSGKDFIDTCKGKKTAGEIISFENCGPKRNIKTILDLKDLAVTTSPEGIDNQRMIFRYREIEGKLFPASVDFKTSLYDQKIQKIDYSGTILSSLEGTSSDGKVSIIFTACRKNHN